jgi:hypothetical protein
MLLLTGKPNFDQRECGSRLGKFTSADSVDPDRSNAGLNAALTMGMSSKSGSGNAQIVRWTTQAWQVAAAALLPDVSQCLVIRRALVRVRVRSRGRRSC